MTEPAAMLDRNELPYPPHETVSAAARDALAFAQAYPSWDAVGLRRELAKRHGVDPDWLVAAAGSVAVIAQAMAVAGPGELILPWPSFDAFPPLAGARGLRPVLTGIRADGACDPSAVRAALTDRTSMILICTPNSPTGGVLGRDELGPLLDRLPGHILVLIDQAYAEFADQPDPPCLAELATAHPRTLITRTFSKAYGLAGLRVGYGLARPELCEAIAAAGVPYAVTAAAEAAAIRTLRQPEHLRATVAKVRVERARLARALRELGTNVIAGHGNFIWVPQVNDVPGTVDRLAAAGVQVKGYPGHGIRISVGTSTDTDILLHAWSHTQVQDGCPHPASTSA